MPSDGIKIIVVGGGQAGGRAALAARAVSPDAHITVIAAEPHYPYERPVLSKAVLLNQEANAPRVLDEQAAIEGRISVRRECSATSIERRAKRLTLSDGSTLDYDKLVLATGSRLRQVTIPGASQSDVRYLRSIEDSFELRRVLQLGASIAIVGGGFIGLEVAASAIALGCSVLVVESAPLLLARLGSEQASEFVRRHHVSRGVDIRLGVQCVAFGDGKLRLSDGGERSVDVLVAGVGVAPAVDLATAADLVVDNGIVTDKFGRTSDPDIFAAGDVTNQDNGVLGRRVHLKSWDNANEQGTAAGRSAAGELTDASIAPWFWSDQGDLNIQIAGVPVEVTRSIVRGSMEDGMTIFQLRDTQLIGAITLNRARDMPLIRRALNQSGISIDPNALSDDAAPLRKILRPG